MNTCLDNIRIVLVETSHTGNMGSVARAMKTMGLKHLYLVNPIVKPDSQTIALAAGASDIIQQHCLTSSLDDAIADCELVIGTSARQRSLAWPLLDSRECGAKIVQSSQHSKVALVFGRERVGLTNQELQKCHYHVAINTNPEYSSLNLAMAVQVLCYEIRMMATANQHPLNKPINEYPTATELEQFYHHLQQSLLEIQFIKENHPGMIMEKLRRLFTRSHLEKQELNILRGILTAFQKKQ